MLAPFTVNSFLDNGDGANTTLREAVLASNQSQDPEDIIKFDETVFANGGVIQLTQGDLPVSETTKLFIDGRNSVGVPLGIIIKAHDPTSTQKNGDGSRVFNITGGNVEINSLTLTGGDVEGNGGAIHSISASLTIADCLLTGNSAASAA